MRKYLFTILFLFPSLSWGVTYYAARDGNDAWPGTSTTSPVLTLHKLMDLIDVGGVSSHAYVKAGTYWEQDGANSSVAHQTQPGNTSNTINIEGYNNSPGDGTFACVTVDASSSTLTNCVSGDVGYISWKNFRFTGASAAGFNGTTADGRSFSGCRFDNNGTVGVYSDRYGSFDQCQADNNGGVGFSTSWHTNFNGCVAFSNSGKGILATTAASVVNCISYENATAQIDVADWSTVANNTVDGGGSTVGIQTGYLSAVYNNIITSCTTGILNDGAANTDASLFVDYNLYDDCTTDQSNVTDRGNNVSGDPLFTDEAGNDYRLGVGSPALEVGMDGGILGAGTESFIDIGAHQYDVPAGGGTVVVILED
jgi:hypothetical protein